MDPIQKYTDFTYGVLLVAGIVLMLLFDSDPLFAGLGIGIFIGYAVHVGSEVVEFSSMMDDVEETKETVTEAKTAVEETRDVVEQVEQNSERAVEKVEETKETVEEVESKTDRVEGAVNANND